MCIRDRIKTGLVPVAHHRALRDVEQRCDFGEGKAAEEMQIDQFRERFVHGGELIERVADALEIERIAGELARLGRYRGDLEPRTSVSYTHLTLPTSDLV